MLDKEYENVYEAIAREVKEETGLKVTKIIDDSRTVVFSPQKVDKAFGFRPFCCTQQLKEGRPWVGFVFRCEVDSSEEPTDQLGETKNVHWMSADEFHGIFTNYPDQIFTLELPAWEYYFKEFPLA